jgi:transcriptional regulator with XRE-family HTH domain
VAEERAAGITDRKLGERVRTRRIEIGMSQEKLAELVGLTFQQVQKYERGDNRIAVGRLLDIAEALDVPPGQLLEGLRSSRPKGKRAKARADEALKPGVAELVRLFGSIKNDKMRRRVLDLVRMMSAGD